MTLAIGLLFSALLPGAIGLTRLLPKAELDRIGREVAAKRRAERRAQAETRPVDEPGE